MSATTSRLKKGRFALAALGVLSTVLGTAAIAGSAHADDWHRDRYWDDGRRDHRDWERERWHRIQEERWREEQRERWRHRRWLESQYYAPPVYYAPPPAYYVQPNGLSLGFNFR